METGNRMENYIKGQTVDVELESDPLDKLGLDMAKCVRMKITAGGKIRNYMGYALKEFDKDERRLITFAGTGDAVSKVISCVEIMKRKCKQLHQINKIYFERKEDFWEPKIEDLDRLKVTRHIPAMTVLLSKDPLDKNEPGYQAPGSFDAQWAKDTAQANAMRQQNIRKKRQTAQQQKGPSKSKKRGGGSGGQTRGPRPQGGRDGQTRRQDGETRGPRPQGKEGGQPRGPSPQGGRDGQTRRQYGDTRGPRPQGKKGGQPRGPSPQGRGEVRNDQNQGQQRHRIYRGKRGGKSQGSEIPKKE